MWKTTLNETSRLTVELRDIVDNGENSVDIWAFDYPTFYEGEQKKAFEQKVIDHYYFRQIGSETVGRFLHQFRTKVREIMPYYIQLYNSEKYMDELEDPFATVNYTETYSETSSGTSSDVTNTTTSTESEDNRTESVDNVNKYSKTPQGSISNLDNYLTEATLNDTSSNENVNVTASGSGESTSTGTSSGTVEHTLTKKGAMGVTTFGHDMIEFRQTFLNIDMLVINELNDLFLKIY